MSAKLSSANANLRPLGILALAAIIFLLPLAFFGPHDQEEWGGSVWSTLQYSLALWDGRLPPMWSDALGLGTPMPLGHRLDFSPPFLLFPFVSVRWVLVIYYAFYLSIALLFLWKICKQYEFSERLSLLVSISFLFSAPTVQLVYLDDWPTLFHNWCFLPVIFYYLRKLLLSSDVTAETNALLALALAGGLWALNGHSGHLFSLATILAVYVFYMLTLKKGKFVKLLLVCCIAAAIASEHLYYLIVETLAFPHDITRTMAQDGLSLRDFAATLIRPFDTFPAVFLRGKSVWDPGILWDGYLTYLNLRTPFVGTLILLTALVSSIGSLVSGDSMKSVDRERRAISLVFLFSFVAMFMKAAWFNNIPSGTWMYRDGVVFFGLIAAGLWLKVHWNSTSRLSKWIPRLIFIHFIQVFSSVYPAFHQTMANPGLYNYENFGKADALPGWISRASDKPGSRLFITTANGPRSWYAKDGLYGVTDLTFLGVTPFTAWIKSVSMDSIGKSLSLGHGWIPGNVDILLNREMLNVFGIDLILVTSKDFESEIFASLRGRFTHLGQYETSSGTVHLLKNPDAWPDAFLMSMDVMNVQAIQRACVYPGAICGDFSGWHKHLLGDKVKMSGEHGAYSIQVEASPTPRLFVTSKLYRPEWEVRSEMQALQVVKVGEALTGVVVPPDVENFTLTFKPAARLVLRGVSAVALVLLVLVILGYRLVKTYQKRAPVLVHKS